MIWSNIHKINPHFLEIFVDYIKDNSEIIIVPKYVNVHIHNTHAVIWLVLMYFSNVRRKILFFGVWCKRTVYRSLRPVVMRFWLVFCLFIMSDTKHIKLRNFVHLIQGVVMMSHSSHITGTLLFLRSPWQLFVPAYVDFHSLVVN